MNLNHFTVKICSNLIKNNEVTKFVKFILSLKASQATKDKIFYLVSNKIFGAKQNYSIIIYREISEYLIKKDINKAIKLAESRKYIPKVYFRNVAYKYIAKHFLENNDIDNFLLFANKIKTKSQKNIYLSDIFIDLFNKSKVEIILPLLTDKDKITLCYRKIIENDIDNWEKYIDKMTVSYHFYEVLKKIAEKLINENNNISILDKYFEQIKDKWNKVEVFTRVASYFYKKQNIEMFNLFIDKSKEIALKEKDDYRQGEILQLISNEFAHLQLYKEAIKIAEIIKFVPNCPYLNKLDAYYCIVQNACLNKRYDIAFKILKRTKRKSYKEIFIKFILQKNNLNNEYQWDDTFEVFIEDTYKYIKNTKYKYLYLINILKYFITIDKLKLYFDLIDEIETTINLIEFKKYLNKKDLHHKFILMSLK